MEEIAPATGIPLRVLNVEDSPDDSALLLHELKKSGYAPMCKRVETEAGMRAALREGQWDIIVSDYEIPGFGGIEALKIARDSGLDLPFVLLSGKIGEDTAVEAMKAGASDFVMKDRLGRLGSVVKRELADAAARRGMRQATIEWRAAFDAIGDAVFLHDSEYRIVRANRAYAVLAGMQVEEVTGKVYWEVFPRRSGPLPGCEHVVNRREGKKEDQFSLPGGETYASRGFAINDERGEYLYSYHVLEDITERQRVKEALEKSERHFRKLIENGADGFIIVDRAGRQLYRSQSGTKLTGWTTHDLVGKDVVSFVHPEDAGAAREALASVIADPDKVARLDLRAMRADGGVAEVEVQAKTYLDDPDVNGIVLTVRDISQRKASEERLKATVNGAIKALSETVEKRDPYTAGHQLRVARLAVAIARTLGWDSARLEGLRVAGTIHDIGKVGVPADILSRPGKLGPAEFELIKGHVQSGYEIVKGIPFAWPVAETILQHHERLDGSGYPQGLKGEQIIMEARILAVADVMEAMCSHRPYRPSHSVNDSLEELESYREIKFDACVVDACAQAFRAQGYAFEPH